MSSSARCSCATPTNSQWMRSWLATPRSVGASSGVLSSELTAHEKAMIEEALRAAGGRVFGPGGAAERLGIPRSTLESRIRTLRINKSRFRRRPARVDP